MSAPHVFVMVQADIISLGLAQMQYCRKCFALAQIDHKIEITMKIELI